MTALATSTGSAPAATAARVVDAVKVYGSGDTAVRALDGVSVDFPAGRFTAIMGPSGSGKSTLMHCAAGLDTLTEGAAYIGDTDLGSPPHRRPPRGPPVPRSPPPRPARRPPPHPAAARPRRLRLPGVQPRPDAQRRREH